MIALFLHWCLQENNSGLLDELFSILVVAKTITIDGKTWLMQAVEMGCVDCVKVLLKHKVTMHAVNKSGQTALDIARQRKELRSEKFQLPGQLMNRKRS